jgi:hypothetical protein
MVPVVDKLCKQNLTVKFLQVICICHFYCGFLAYELCKSLQQLGSLLGLIWSSPMNLCSTNPPELSKGIECVL